MPTITIILATKGKPHSKAPCFVHISAKPIIRWKTITSNMDFPQAIATRTPRIHQNPNSTQDKDNVITKEDYQHLMLLRQQSRKDHTQAKNDKSLNYDTGVISCR